MITNEAHWTRGSWIAFGASTLLILAMLIVLTYRSTLPTDGWAVDTDNEGYGFIDNLSNVPSALQIGDLPLAVGGVPIESITNITLMQRGALPESWRVGAALDYTVTRGGQTLTVPVPIINYSPLMVWNGFVKSWGFNLIALFYFLIGAFVFLLRPGNPAAQVLYFLGSVRLGMAIVLVIPITLGDFGDVFANTGVTLLGFYSWGMLLFPTFLLLSFVFPKPKRPFRTHPLLTLAGLYLLVPAVLLFFALTSPELGPEVGYDMVAVYGLLTVTSIIHTLITERGDAVARAQMLWVGLAVALVTGFQFIENVLPTDFGSSQNSLFAAVQVLGAVISLLLPLSIAIAVLRYRLFDIDVLIRRTLMYGLLTAALLVVYFGSVFVLQRIFSSLTPQSPGGIVTVLSTLAIAALFVPLRNWIQQAIDKRFNRRKYDAQQVLTKFAVTARDETDLEKLSSELVSVLSETMQPKSVSVWLSRRPQMPRKFE